jgi:hypothetical protein
VGSEMCIRDSCRYVQQIEEEDITGTIIALMFALSVLFPVGTSLALYNIILSIVRSHAR